RIENTGNVTLKGVTPIDAGPVFADQTASGTLSAFLPAPVQLAPGEAQTFTATYTLAQPDIDAAAGMEDAGSNTARAIANAPDAGGGPRQAESGERTAGRRLPEPGPLAPRLAGQALKLAIRRGELARFRIAAQDAHSATVGRVTSADTIPAGFRFVVGMAGV